MYPLGFDNSTAIPGLRQYNAAEAIQKTDGTKFYLVRMTKSIPDSAYVKDIFVSSYKITKTTLATIIPTTAYSFLRFAPYGDTTDPLLANFISYSVFPVGAMNSAIRIPAV